MTALTGAPPGVGVVCVAPQLRWYSCAQWLQHACVARSHNLFAAVMLALLAQLLWLVVMFMCW
jgi:hypothetical protein